MFKFRNPPGRAAAPQTPLQRLRRLKDLAAQTENPKLRIYFLAFAAYWAEEHAKSKAPNTPDIERYADPSARPFYID